MSIISDFVRTTFFGGKVDETKEAKKEQNKQTNNVNPNNVSYKDPIIDSFGFSSEKKSDTFKNLSTMFLVGFCLSSFPDLLLFGVGMFLFAKHKDTFKETLENMIKQSTDAFSKLNQQVNAQQTAAAPQQTAPQQAAPKQAAETAVTNPVAPAKEVKPMSPLERAELRYANAENRVIKYDLNLRKSYHAAEVADKKLSLAKERMEKAKLSLETAKEEAKAAAAQKLERAENLYARKYAESQIANEAVDVANAKLEDAKLKLDIALKARENIISQETVNV